MLRFPARFFILFVSALMLIGIVTSVQAQDNQGILILDDPQTRYQVGLHLEYMEDPGGSLTIEDVTKPEYNDRFTQNLEEDPNFGYTHSAYWFRFQVQNETSQVREWFLAFSDARLGQIDLYSQTDGTSGWAHQQAGRWLPATAREYIHPHFVLPLEISPSNDGTVYLRIQALLPIRFSLTLWPAGSFEQLNHTFFLVLGLFYGIGIIMAFYNLMISIFLRNRTYLYYFFFISTLIISTACIDGVAYAYIFPNFAHRYTHLVIISLAPITAILFIRNFLELKRISPIIDRTLITLAAICGLLFSFYFFRNYALARTALTTLFILQIIIAIIGISGAVLAMKKGLPAGRYFLIACLAIFLNVIFRNSSVQGFIPNSPIYDWTFYFSVVWMVTLFAVALADQINILRNQAVQAGRAQQLVEERFRLLYEYAPMGIVIADRDSIIVKANLAIQEILGFTEQELMSKHILDMVYPDDRTSTEQNYQQLMHKEKAYYKGEVRYLKKDGNPIWVWRSVSSLQNADGEIYQTFAMVNDISDRKAQEQQLRRYSEDLEGLVAARTHDLEVSREKLAILNRSSQAINIAGLDREQVYVAIRAACAWLVPADVVAITLLDEENEKLEVVFLMDRDQRLTPSNFPVEDSFIIDVLESGNTMIVHDYQSKQDSPFSREGVRSGMAVPLRGSREIMGVLTVQSYNPYAYSEADRSTLESFSAHVSITLENIRHFERLERSAILEERQRLASDLHDSVTQLLYSIAMMSNGWGLRASENELLEPASQFSQIEDLSLQALKEMRMLIHQLRLPALSEIGLVEALEDRMEKVERRLNIDAKLNITGSMPKLPAVVEEQIYFIVLEALNNSLRHSRSTATNINILVKDHQLKIAVEDNGRGYEPSLSSRGLGVAAMETRASAIGANLMLDSHAGQGAKVELKIKI